MPAKQDNKRQVRIRVNAWVDESLAPLVEALNDFPDLITLDSNQDRRGDTAWVSFGHRMGDANETLAFIQFLASELENRMPTDSGCRVGLEWKLGGAKSFAKIEAPQKEIFDLAQVLQEVASGELVS